MSYSNAGGVRFQVNRNTGGTGIFWQQEKAKNDARKFGYKSKTLRHPIRRPDEEAAIAEYEAAKEKEAKKFNKENKDFIGRNKNRYKPKEDTRPEPDSTHIKPGTVTLTQEQLVALLASLGNKDKSGKEDSMKISIDASNNKIEVEKYESDSGDDVNIDDYNKEEEEVGSGGIYGLLNETGNKPAKERKSKNRRREKDNNNKKEERERERQKEEAPVNERSSPKVSTRPPPHPANAPQARSSLEVAKEEAGVSHVPPTVPWRHMTVGEKKRLQWAREKAELEEAYNPWGRPGAGAPPANKEAPQPSQQARQEEEKKEKNREPIVDNTETIDSILQKYSSGQKSEKAKFEEEKRRKQEELESEIEKLRVEIRETEERKKLEEERIKRAREEREGKTRPSEKANRREEKKEEQKRTRKEGDERRKEPQRAAAEPDEQKVQVVIITKKKKKMRDSEEEGVQSSLENEDDSEKENRTESKKKKEKHRAEGESKAKAKFPDESLQDFSKSGSVERKPEVSKEEEEKAAKVDEPSSKSGSYSLLRADEFAGLTKKEIERRKWLAELDKQREEQRMMKQREKERNRSGIDDQWADRFVQHKTLKHISPRHARAAESRAQESVLGRAPEYSVEREAPPAAMRSSIVVGAGTLNETRYDNSKAEEKRRWLAELEKQREEQRMAKAAQKHRDQQDDGTWADRYPTDHHKLLHVNHARGQGLTPRVEVTETQRTNSAPQAEIPAIPAVSNVRESQEDPTNFLRGQGVYVDPVTRKEQEEKRRVYLEYQAQVKAQIEEKERQKKEERERKFREDMEEERKLQLEREKFQKQAEMENKKLKEKEVQREKQIAALKSAMDEAQERAQEEKNVKRMHHLQQRGHDVSHLKATYEDNAEQNAKTTTPRIKEYEPSDIPGLDVAPAIENKTVDPITTRVNQEPSRGAPRRTEARPMGQSYTKEPYVEDRVLTPSRFRDPSRPRDDPESPRREFGTQTLELKDLQAILKSLPDEVQIEYKMKVEEALKEKEKKSAPTRKVHVKSAEQNPRGRKPVQEKPAAKEQPLKPGERPPWNARRRKTVVKNSEKDPFYEQKRIESELRKMKRERQLQYLQDLNKERIPSLSKSPVRSRDVSPEAVRPVRKPPTGPGPGAGAAKGKPHGDKARGRAANKQDTAPNILSLLNDGDRRSKSPVTTGRNSPPIPAVRHKLVNGNDGTDAYSYTNNYLRTSQNESRYGDMAIETAPTSDGDFVPFMRTTEILDPARADEPLMMSRENSRMERARRAYHETHNPANKGKKLDVYQDRQREAALKDPIMNPSLVTEHPSARQDMILQQLSSLKQTLMQRQRELETNMGDGPGLDQGQ